MLQLTSQALQKVRDVIAAQEDSKSYRGIRVSVVGGGCSGFQYTMKLEKEQRAEDQVIQFDGVQVFLDEQSLLYLEGTEIDYVETLHGAGFKFNNPNVASTCGCGESFQV